MTKPLIIIAGALCWLLVFSWLSAKFRRDAFGGRRNLRTRASVALYSVGFGGVLLILIVALAFGVYRRAVLGDL